MSHAITDSGNAVSRCVDEPLAAVDWTGRSVTVMGLGRHGGGVAAARYLATRGACVTVSDSADAATLEDSIAELDGVPTTAFKLGGHDPVDFRTDFVVVNPAVRPDHPSLRIARKWGARLISETELFLAHCRARIIGVTGSNGKSTTATMLYEILRAAGRRTWLGGNIGNSLLGELDRIAADDWVVLELSSFQLAHLSEGVRLPEIALVTNCSPNHLDWHADFADYRAAKQRLVREQPRTLSGSSRVVVLNALDEEVASWSNLAAGRTIASWPHARLGPLAVPGDHNRQNAACAAAAAEAAGVDALSIVRALAGFRGLPHRLQSLGTVAGRHFYNDSKSTTPQATIAALEALSGPVWLLAGGHSKGADFGELAGAVVKRARGVAVFGAARDSLRAAIAHQRGEFDLFAAEQLAEALDGCWRRSRPGDSILLSPACASFDQFQDFSQRGETFRALVAEIAARGAAG